MMQENSQVPHSKKDTKTLGKVRNMCMSKPWFREMAASDLQLSESEDTTASVITLPSFMEKGYPHLIFAKICL